MARKFISFLGTGNYQQCAYSIGDTRVNDVKYIQLALINLLCKGWNPNDTVQIFLTKDARDKNWDVQSGLKSCLQQLKESDDFNFTITAIDIPDGKNENEIREIFSIVNNTISNADEIIFDITHGFRSIPMLGIVLLNYAKVLKSIKLKGVYYGAWEAKENDIAPIFDLTEFDKLLAWAVAADQFVSSGNAKKIAMLTNNQVGDVFRSGGDNQQTKKIAPMVNRFSQQLDKLTASISACRLKEIAVNADDLNQTCRSIKTLKGFEIIEPLIAKVATEFECFIGNTLESGIAIAQWCHRHNMIQQGFTILQESATSFVLETVGCSAQEVDDYSIRRLISTIEPSDNKYFQPIRDWMSKNVEFAKNHRNISDLRNDINHAGIRKHCCSAESLKNYLQSSIDKMKNFQNSEY